MWLVHGHTYDEQKQIKNSAFNNNDAQHRYNVCLRMLQTIGDKEVVCVITNNSHVSYGKILGAL